MKNIDPIWWMALGALMAWLAAWILDQWQGREVVNEFEEKNQRELARLQQKEDQWTKESQALSFAQISLETSEAKLTALRLELENNRCLTHNLAQNLTETKLRLTAAQEEYVRVTERLDAIRTQSVRSREALNRQATEKSEKLYLRDPLEKINGIGITYQQKLWDAGILTFEQMVATPPSRVREIIAPREWQFIDENRWITEAANHLIESQRSEVLLG